MSLKDNNKGEILLYRDDGATELYITKSIKFEQHSNGVAVVTYDTPDNLNAITPNQHMETFAILEHCKRSEACKALLWTGTGRAFNAGVSLKGDKNVYIPKDIVKEYRARGMAPGKDVVLRPLTLAFWNFPKPIVAAINGLCVGGGANMALCNYYDLVYCSEEAKFKYPFVSLGFTPELGSSRMMPFTVGMARAKEMMMLGEWFTATDADRMGLINGVCASQAELYDRAYASAEKLAKSPAAQVSLAKRVLNHHICKDMEYILDTEQSTIAESLQRGGRELMMGKRKERTNNHKNKSKL